MDDKKIKSFTDVYAWQEGHKLVLIIYLITGLKKIKSKNT